MMLDFVVCITYNILSTNHYERDVIFDFSEKKEVEMGP